MTPRRFLPRRRYFLYRGELSDIARLIARGRVADGPEVEQFETELAEYLGGGEVIAVNSGRVGLLVLLEALGLAAGDEILVPAYTLRALVELLASEGYVPVPVDIDPHTFDMDPDDLRQRIGPKSRAVLPTHLFGRPAEMESIAAVAAEHELAVVEDCAQALGAEVGEDKVGTLGHAAIFSFDLLKSVNTFGGGAVFTRDSALAGRLRDIRGRFRRAGNQIVKRIAVGLAEHAVLIGPTAPLVAAALDHPWTRPLVERGYRSMQNAVRPTEALFSNLQAHIGRRQLASLDGRVAVRRTMARRLERLLGERPIATMAPGESGYFFVRCVDGDAAALRRELRAAGIDAGVGSEIADYCGDLGRADACLHARYVFEHAIQLPLHEGLTDPDLERIAKVCAGRLRGRTRARARGRA